MLIQPSPIARPHRTFIKEVASHGASEQTWPTTPNLNCPADDADGGVESIETAYTSPPWWYDMRGFLILKFAYRSTLLGQVRFFAEHVGDRHLDVGVGTGSLLRMVLGLRQIRRRPVSTVVGVDSSATMLSGAKRRLGGLRGVKLLHQDVAKLSTTERDFDSAAIANSLHCFDDPRAALRAIHDLLTPGGTLAANVLLYPKGGFVGRHIANAINEWGANKGILVTPYEAEEIREMLASAQFDLIEESISGNCYAFVAKKKTQVDAMS